MNTVEEKVNAVKYELSKIGIDKTTRALCVLEKGDDRVIRYKMASQNMTLTVYMPFTKSFEGLQVAVQSAVFEVHEAELHKILNILNVELNCYASCTYEQSIKSVLFSAPDRREGDTFEPQAYVGACLYEVDKFTDDLLPRILEAIGIKGTNRTLVEQQNQEVPGALKRYTRK